MKPAGQAKPLSLQCTAIANIVDPGLDLDQRNGSQVAYKERMIGSRFIATVLAVLLVVVSMTMGASAGMAACAPDQQHSATVQQGSGADANAGCQDLDHQGKACADGCLGSSCFAAGLMAQEMAGVAAALSANQLEAGLIDVLSGRLIAPETGPPRLPA